MCIKYSLLVAVEYYQDKSIPSVKYAENDAKELSKVFLELEFNKDEQAILLSTEATKATIESKIRKILKYLKEDDVFYFFYAGHGFSENGNNYITCHDTQLDDITETSIELQLIYQEIRNSICKHVVIFLDSCESGINIDQSMRGIFSNLSDDELKDFFKDNEYAVCFASCKNTESSYSSIQLTHGIWTHHLIQALSGEDAIALENQTYITSISLQNYLSQSIPRTLRSTITTQDTQTPWMCGGMTGDFLIADLTELLNKKRTKANPNIQQLKRVLFSFTDYKNIKSLQGFEKNHTVPKYVNNTTRNFAESISEDDLAEEINKVFDKLRKSLKYKRRDMKILDQETGCRTIQTPDFNYNVSYECNFFPLFMLPLLKV
jgi:Caspase domain